MRHEAIDIPIRTTVNSFRCSKFCTRWPDRTEKIFRLTRADVMSAPAHIVMRSISYRCSLSNGKYSIQQKKKLLTTNEYSSLGSLGSCCSLEFYFYYYYYRRATGMAIENNPNWLLKSLFYSFPMASSPSTLVCLSCWWCVWARIERWVQMVGEHQPTESSEQITILRSPTNTSTHSNQSRTKLDSTFA